MTLHKVLKYLAIVIGVIGAILLARIFIEGDDALENSAAAQASIVDPYIIVAYIVFAAVILMVGIFVIKGLFRGNIKNTLIAIGAFVVIVLAAYLLSSGAEAVEMKNGDLVSASTAQWISTGLRTFYILAFIAVGAMVTSGIKKLTK